MQIDFPLNVATLHFLAWLLFVCALASFTMRILTRIIHPNGLAGDTLFHLYCARAIRINGKRPEYLDGFAWNNTYTYPPLYHQFLALFPERYLVVFERFTSVLFDSIQFLAVFATARIVLADAASPFHWALAIASANALSPVFNTHIWGPRAMTGTGRTMGEAMFVTGACCLLLHTTTGNVLWLIPAGLCLGPLPLASKFATQVLFFLTIACVIAGYWLIPAVIVLSAMLAAVISKKHLFRVILGQIQHSIFYMSFLQQRYYSLHNNTMYSLKTYLWRSAAAGYNAIKAPRNFINWLLFDPSFYHIILFYNLHLWSLMLVLFFPGLKTTMPDSPTGSLLVFLSIASLLPTMITSFRGVRFLGESYRYLEYFQWAIWLLLASVSPPLFLVIALLYAAASFIFIKRAASIIKSWEERYEDTAKFYESVKSEVQGGRCFPLDGSYYEILARGDVKVLCWAGNMRLSAVPAQDMDTLFGRFPYPRKGKDFVSVLKRHGVTHVTCAKASLDIIGREFEHKMDVIPTPSTSHMLYKIL